MDRMTFLYLGLAPSFIVYILASYKKLRNNRVLTRLAIVTLLIALLGVFINKEGSLFLASAFFYVIIYAGLRYIYLKKYSIEPTYNRASWYDPEEGRKQNWLDVIVFVIPLMLSLVMPLVLTIAQSKTLHFY